MNDGAPAAQLRQQLGRLANRMRHVLQRAFVSAPADEREGTQKLQVRALQGEVVRDVPSYQLYGFASSPLPGCEVITVQGNGESAFGFAVASNDPRHRPRNVSGGAVMLYNDGHTQVLLAGKQLIVTAAEQVVLHTPKLVVNGDVEATGDVRAGTVSLKQHRHINSGGSGLGGTPQQ